MKIPAQMFLQEYRFLQGLIGNVQTPHIFFFLFNWQIWAKIGNNSQQILTTKETNYYQTIFNVCLRRYINKSMVGVHDEAINV